MPEHICSNPGCRANSIAEALNVTTRIVERHIRLLREQNRIEFRGAPKTGGYFPFFEALIGTWNISI